VTNTQRSTSQGDGADSDSSGFSFSLSSPIIGNSCKDEWILDSGTIYHACPNRGWFSSFEKLEGYSVVMGDDHSCSMEGVGTIPIRMFDGIVRELTGVKRNLIFVEILETSGMVISVRDGDLRMIKGSMVVMKGVRRGNLYYLKGSTITDQVETLSSSYDSGLEVWRGKVRQKEEKYLRAPAKMESLEGAATCKLEGEHSVLNKKKVRFSTSTHHNEALLDCVHMSVWGPTKTASLGDHR